MKKISCSIGIPTYNRPDSLCRRLNEISQVMGFVDEVIIYDNSEDVSAAVVVAVGNALRTYKCSYVKNIVNIGPGANFLRVLENATTDFMWWRGDDDLITHAQAEAVRRNLSDDPRLIILSAGVKEEFFGKGIDSFIDSLDKMSMLGWVSSIVLPVEIAKKVLNFGYAGIGSNWPQVVLMLSMFRVEHDLEFVIAPITMESDQFCDVGKTEVRWPYFNTGIRQFKETASFLPSKSLKKRYLQNWRRTRKFSEVKTMARFKLGYMKQEDISMHTFLPYVSIYNPRTTLLAIILFVMAKIPRHAYQLVFPLVWLRLSYQERVKLDLPFLLQYEKYGDLYKALRQSKKKDIVLGTVL